VNDATNNPVPGGNITLNTAASGTYTYTLQGNACPNDEAIYTLTVQAPLSTSGLTTICNAAQTQYTVTFVINNGSGAGTYTVTGMSGGTVTGNTFTSNPINAGTNYSFTVSDSGPCGDITVTGASPNCSCPATASIATTNQTICQGQTVNLEIVTSGSGPWVVNVSPLGNQNIPVSGTTIPVTPAATTTYTLTSVSDANCAGTAAGSVTITVQNPVDAGPDVDIVECATGGPYSLLNAIPPGVSTIGSWVNNATNNPVPGGNITLNTAASGTYTYTLQGNACPNDEAIYTLTVQAPLSTSGLTTICNAAQTQYTVTFVINNGSGAGTYTVTGMSGGTVTGNTFTSNPINAGTNYSFTVSDSGPCGDITVTGASPNCSCPATASIATTNQTICQGQTVNLEIVTSGSGPWVVNVSPLGNQNIPVSGTTIPVTPAATTTYTLTSVSDANCAGTAAGSVTITVQDPVSAGGNTNTEYCATGGTLTLNTLLTSGPSPNSGWTNNATNNPVPGGNITLNTAAAGTYTYTVQGGACPNATSSHTIAVYSPISISGFQAFCDASQTGYIISFTINGGNGNYNATGIPGTIAGNSFLSDLITDPTYTINIGDTGPCNAIIQSGNAPICNCPAAGSISGTTSICQGSCATLTFNLQGQEPFSLIYQNSNDPGNPIALSNIFNGHTVTVCPAANTTYTLLSMSDANCSGAVQGQPVTVSVNAPLAVGTVTEVCSPTADTYTVSFPISGGLAPITILPAGGTFIGGVYTSAPQPITGTANYSFTVNSGSVCGPVTVSGSVTCSCITNAGSISTSALTLCANETAQVSALGVILDANDILQYVLHNGTATTLGTILATSNTGSFTFGGSMVAGQTYYITAIAGNATPQGTVNQNDPCFDTSNGVAVVFNALPTASISGNNTVCPGDEATFNVTLTGQGPWTYVYSISGNGGPITVQSTSGNSPIVSNVPGTYTLVSVSDANCAGTVTGLATLANHTPPTAVMTGNPNVCAGSGNGPLVTLSGQGPWTFNYSINGIAQNSITTSQANFTIAAQESGLYSLTSVQNANCPGSVSGALAVNVIPVPTAQITGGGTVCEGGQSPFTVLLTGSGPWNVQYAAGGVPQPPLNGIQNGHIFNSGVAGTYSIISVNDQNCPGQAIGSTAQLTVKPLPHAQIVTNTNVICVGQQLNITFNMAGTPPYAITYVLGTDTLSLNSIPNNFTLNLNPVEPVFAAVLNVVDSSTPQCTSNTPAATFVQITQMPNAPVIANREPIACSGEAIAIGAPPSPGITYSWTPTTGLSNANISNPTLLRRVGGFSKQTFTYVLNASNGECATRDTIKVTIDPGPRANFSYGPTPVSSIDPNVRFTNLSIANELTGFYWDFAGLGESFAENPTFKFPEGKEGTYKVTLTAMDIESGCKDEYIDFVQVRPEMLVFVPNAFTPDADGKNDLWGPVLTNVDEDNYRLTVYDRSGSIVFETRDVNKKWNGSLNGGDYYVKNDVYVWIIETKNKLSLEEREFRGTVVVIR
jgi:gliding motility-associated-like protein